MDPSPSKLWNQSMLLFLAFNPTFPPRCGLPRACSNSCPLSWWCHPTISSSVVPFCSCLQSFPASGSFPPRCGPYFLGSRITADGDCSYQIKRCLLLGNKAITNLDSRIWLSDFTFTFHFHFSLSCIWEGNGNPLQCSCLENPRDRGCQWGCTESDTT